MTIHNSQYSRQELRERLTRSFSIDEIKVICFDIGINYEEFSNKKSMLIIELLQYLENKGQLAILHERLEWNSNKTKHAPKNLQERTQLIVNESLDFLKGLQLAEWQSIILNFKSDHLELFIKLNAETFDVMHQLINNINSNPDFLITEISLNFAGSTPISDEPFYNELSDNDDLKDSENVSSED